MARATPGVERQTTRSRLLDAAEEEFGNAGFSGARLADIAARIGIRRPSLLYHFSTKKALYEAVVERTFADLATALATAMQAAHGFSERIVAPLRQFAEFLERRPAAARILLREVLDGQGPGREIIVRQGGPILSLVEAYIRSEAGSRLPADFPVRASLMQAVCNLLVWSSAGPLRVPLWGGGHHAVVLSLQGDGHHHATTPPCSLTTDDCRQRLTGVVGRRSCEQR